MTDEQIQQAKKGDKDSFTQLIVSYQNEAYRLSYVYLHHEQDSMDAVCSGIEKAWRKLPTLRNPESFKSWFLQIVVNEALMMLKKRKRFVAASDTELEFIPAPVWDDDGILLSELLDGLDQGTRQLVGMKYLLGYTLKEISSISGIPEGTVKTRIYSCLKKMNRQLYREELS